MTSRCHCPHCNQWLSLKTYRAHKRLFYNEDTDEWLKSETVHSVQFPVATDHGLSNRDQEPPPQTDEEDIMDEVQAQQSPPLSEFKSTLQ